MKGGGGSTNGSRARVIQGGQNPNQSLAPISKDLPYARCGRLKRRATTGVGKRTAKRDRRLKTSWVSREVGGDRKKVPDGWWKAGEKK